MAPDASSSLLTHNRHLIACEGPVIPFEIDPHFSNPERVLQAIRDHWEERTNIRFVRRAGQGHYVLFRHGQQCITPIVPQSGMHPITCTPDALVFVIVHEIGHALGFVHEHQQSDRDDFVDVREANIQPDLAYAFKRIVNSINLTDYDPRSIMHYGTFEHSANGEPTLLPKDPTVILNNSNTFTTADIQAINERYPNVGIVRRSDSGHQAAGKVSEIAIAHKSSASADVVTAVRDDAGRLLLILWRIDSNGGIRRLADSGDQAGKASSIAIASGQYFVTACRADDGHLLLISWSTAEDKFSRIADSGKAAGKASLMRILALDGELFVTACCNDDGELLLLTWRTDSNAIQRLADSEGQAGKVSEISLLRVRQLGADHLVATTVRQADGRVLTTVWKIDANGRISRLGDSRTAIGDGTLIESAIDPTTGLLVVSCKSASDTLLVITLLVEDNGTVRRRASAEAERIQGNALMGRPPGVVSAVKAASDNLLLINWRITAAGEVQRGGDSSPDQAGGVGLVRLGIDTQQSDAPTLTCVQTEANELKLITWDNQPEHGELT